MGIGVMGSGGNLGGGGGSKGGLDGGEIGGGGEGGGEIGGGGEGEGHASMLGTSVLKEHASGSTPL